MLGTHINNLFDVTLPTLPTGPPFIFTLCLFKEVSGLD